MNELPQPMAADWQNGCHHESNVRGNEFHLGKFATTSTNPSAPGQVQFFTIRSGKKWKCSSPIRVKRFVVESETRTEKGNLKNSQKEESVVIVARVADGREASTFRISTAFAAPRAWIPPEQDNQQLISISRCAAMKQGRTLFVFYRLRHFELWQRCKGSLIS